jgi:glycosyltransferase involved in cell wall biosynthesis
VPPPGEPILKKPEVTIVTPTLRRPAEVAGLLVNLARQTVAPKELIIVDGAPPEETATAACVAAARAGLPFPVRYLRHGGGTAIQRNVGIAEVTTPLVALIDDDIRLEPDFLDRIGAVFAADGSGRIGGVVGYRSNQHFDGRSGRWRWYRRLGLFSTYEPGRYDYTSGIPINVNLQPPFEGVREIDFMTTACAVWRREVFAKLQFDPFFQDYGMLEDAHFALRAGREWRLLQCGDARCMHLHAPGGRVSRRRIGFKCVVNYYYVFQDVAGPLSWQQNGRFWSFQLFELLRMLSSALRRRSRGDLAELGGRIEGFVYILRGGLSVATGRRLT